MGIKHYNVINYWYYFMTIKYTKNFLEKLEAQLQGLGYTVRYEKGNFKSGCCVLKSQKVIVVNKYFTLEGKINSLFELLQNIQNEEVIVE